MAFEPPGREEPPFLGGSRGRAVSALSQGLRDREVLLLLTGPAGAGKTIVLDAAITTLADESIRVIRLSNPGGLAWCPRDVARQIIGRSVDVSTDDTVSAVVAELTATAADKDQLVVAVDDAQTLTGDAMEFLLLLASPARGNRIAPQLILAGRGDFWERQRRGELQLIARLAARVSLEEFAGTEARDYVAFCLRRDRGPNDDSVVAPEALAEILRYSSGLPTRINLILSTSTSIRICRGSRVLTCDMVEAAIASLSPAPETPGSFAASLAARLGSGDASPISHGLTTSDAVSSRLPGPVGPGMADTASVPGFEPTADDRSRAFFTGPSAISPDRPASQPDPAAPNPRRANGAAPGDHAGPSVWGRDRRTQALSPGAPGSTRRSGAGTPRACRGGHAIRVGHWN